MSKLIALVATAVIVDGVRTVIQPGEPLPDLHEHDERALTGSGAAQDPVATAREAKQEAAAQREAMAGFHANRDAVLGAAESTATSAEQTEQATAPARKAAKKS